MTDIVIAPWTGPMNRIRMPVLDPKRGQGLSQVEANQHRHHQGEQEKSARNLHYFYLDLTHFYLSIAIITARQHRSLHVLNNPICGFHFPALMMAFVTVVTEPMKKTTVLQHVRIYVKKC
jgi:hypothetical protein